MTGYIFHRMSLRCLFKHGEDPRVNVASRTGEDIRQHEEKMLTCRIPVPLRFSLNGTLHRPGHSPPTDEQVKEQ